MKPEDINAFFRCPLEFSLKVPSKSLLNYTVYILIMLFRMLTMCYELMTFERFGVGKIAEDVKLT